MSHIVHLERRITHRYVGTYQHLDEWRYVGKAKVLAPRVIDEGNDYDDVGTYLMHAHIPAGQDPKQTQRALADYFTSEGCAHEYDCCGCVSTRARVKRLTPRTFSILVRKSRNY